jgi:hypothetical protein
MHGRTAAAASLTGCAGGVIGFLRPISPSRNGRTFFEWSAVSSRDEAWAQKEEIHPHHKPIAIADRAAAGESFLGEDTQRPCADT